MANGLPTAVPITAMASPQPNHYFYAIVYIELKESFSVPHNNFVLPEMIINERAN